MNRNILSNLILSSLAALFLYTAVSKIFAWDTFRGEMYNQPFPIWFSAILVWFIPVAEILIGGLLVFKTFRIYGLIFSFVLLCLFTGYVALILLHVFDRVPCSCGGVLKSMSWKVHLVFNIGFTVLAAVGIIFERKRLRDLSA